VECIPAIERSQAAIYPAASVLLFEVGGASYPSAEWSRLLLQVSPITPRSPSQLTYPWVLYRPREYIAPVPSAAAPRAFGARARPFRDDPGFGKVVRIGPTAFITHCSPLRDGAATMGAGHEQCSGSRQSCRRYL
jgi:hypothetical protein